MTKILIIDAYYYEEIGDALLEGAVKALDAAGVAYDRLKVPGALEVPATIRMAETSRRQTGEGYDGYVALGCVIRGETSHYDIVAGDSARAMVDLSLEDGGLCIGNGILTVETRDQALARARVTEKDKGGFAANACMRMIEIKRQFEAQV